MKDIETVYCDGHNITMYDPNGNISISAPLNLDSFIMDVKYDGGSLVITHSDGREERICTDALVDDSLGRIWGSSGGDGYYHDSNSTNAILARITAKVLGEFLQTPDGVRAIEKELNNYFNGTS